MNHSNPIETNKANKIATSAPGRICLFGEHQDYLGLPVIAMAVNLRFFVEYTPDDRNGYEIQTPDLGTEHQILDIFATKPRHSEDYCWGIAQVLLEEGFSFPKGGQVVFHSKIPVRAGCSSSSAMSAAWMRLLLEIGEHPKKATYLENPQRIAHLVYLGEKERFHGSGGMMDQYSCTLGGLIHVYPMNATKTGSEIAESGYGVESFVSTLDDIILIDSGEPKDTQGVLSRASQRAREAVNRVQADWNEFSLQKTGVTEFQKRMPAHSDVTTMVLDQLRNRDLCQEALEIFRNHQAQQESPGRSAERLFLDESSAHRLGAMLNEEHRILSQTVGISTSRIDQIQELTLRAGALGSKINGSGGGGTLFCFAPGQTAQVSQVLKQENIRHFLVHADLGAKREK